MARGDEDLNYLDPRKFDIEQMKRDFSESGMTQFDEFVRSRLDAWKSVIIKIAVCGNSGAGKSTLINALRDMGDDESGAAPVGATQCTLEPTPYEDKTNKNLVFWDMPSVGTPQFPREAMEGRPPIKITYLDRIKADEYDVFIIVTKDRFTDNDLWLAEELHRRNKRFYFVRTHLQALIDNLNRGFRGRQRVNEDGVTARIRLEIKENLKDLYDDQRCFLIDSYEQNKFQFPDLYPKLASDLQENQLKAIAHHVTLAGSEILKSIQNQLEKRIFWQAVVAGASDLAPVPGLGIAVDIGIFVREALHIMQLTLPFDS
jgi:GTP-binding protein EngB required for normal cell division